MTVLTLMRLPTFDTLKTSPMELCPLSISMALRAVVSESPLSAEVRPEHAWMALPACVMCEVGQWENDLLDRVAAGFLSGSGCAGMTRSTADQLVVLHDLVEGRAENLVEGLPTP
jgi:hypothetical protein